MSLSTITRRRSARWLALILALAIAAATVIVSFATMSSARADDTVIRPESTSITVTCTSSKEGTINVVSKFNLAPTDTPPNLRTIVNGTDTNIGTPDGDGFYTASVPYDNTKRYKIVVGYVGNDSVYAGYENFEAGACDGYVDPTPDPTATVTTPSLEYDSSHGQVIISGTATIENAPDGSSQSVTFMVTGPGSPSASSSPVGSYGSSFPVTQTTSSQDFTVVAKVVVDGKVLATSDAASITIEALKPTPTPTPDPTPSPTGTPTPTPSPTGTPTTPPTDGGSHGGGSTPSTSTQPASPSDGSSSTPVTGSKDPYFPGAGTDIVSSTGVSTTGIVKVALFALAGVFGLVCFLMLRRPSRVTARK